MIGLPVLAALLLALSQDPGPAGTSLSGSKDAIPASAPVRPGFSPEQLEQIKQKMEQARRQHEPIRREAIRINELAGNIHSEADARKLVDSVAEVLTNHRHLFWAGKAIRRRVANAEFESASDPAHLISEQHIVDIWNEYVREIDAPAETLITAAELHNFREASYQLNSRYGWKNELSQSIWTMPNVYAVHEDGQLANGCRALEALKIIHDIHEHFINLQAARQRLQRTTGTQESVKEPTKEASISAKPGIAWGVLHAGVSADPIRPAVYRYRQEHGSHAYNQLVRRLFDELFPAVQ